LEIQCAGLKAHQSQQVQAIKAAASELILICQSIEALQQEDNGMLLYIDREFGQIEGAANQQKLGALLVAEPTDPELGKARSVPTPALPAPGGLARFLGILERIRARNHRFNVVRLKAWASELKERALAHDHPGLDRAVAGLISEITRGDERK
jgi:hypothetical protein